MEREEADKKETSEEQEDDLIIEQLKKAKSNMSIWELLIHSSSHRKALTKINIETTASSELMVAKVTKNKHGVITFSDKDLPLEGRNHNKALFILAEVRGKRTNYVMVDDGSAINVCLLKILPHLGLKVNDLAN